MTAYLYDVFGLAILSPHPHRFLPVSAPGLPVDAVVRYGNVPEKLRNPVVERDNPLMRAQIAVGNDCEVLWTTEFGRFLVRDGNSVAIQPSRDPVRPGEIMRFVFSYCVPALLIQRRQAALHANAIATPAGAVVVCGSSGAGKSTLLAALVAAGYPMLSDDVTAIRLNADRRSWVAAGFPQYRLCADALERFAPARDSVRALGGLRNKFIVNAPPHSFHSHACALQAIYLLEIHDRDVVAVHSLHGVDKLSALKEASYAPLCLTYFPEQMNALAAIASTVPVFRVARPRAGWTIDELVDLVTEQHLREQVGT